MVMAASAYSQVQVPKPKNWQDFELGSSILWRKILKDDSLNRFGRGGQEQHGMDMFGYRDADPSKIVGVQCKCNGHHKMPSEDEFRRDFEKALKWEPKLTEYFFTYTADDDGPLHTFAAKLTEEQRLLGRTVIVRAWGWGTFEQRLAEHECADAFDPNFSSVAKRQEQQNQELKTAMDSLREAFLAQSITVSSDASSGTANAADAHLDLEIDRYRDLMTSGKPKSALQLLETLKSSLTDSNSGHIWFRVKANIGHCYLHMGEEAVAAEILDDAVSHAPDDPKAAANKVLAWILTGQDQEALDLALLELKRDETSEILAAYAVQAAGNLGLAEPLSLIPEGLREAQEVMHFHLTNIRAQGGLGWVEVARRTASQWPENESFRRHLAEGEIEAIVMGDHSQTWRLKPEDKGVLEKASDELIGLWNQARKTEVPGRQDNVALCVNAVVALIVLGERARAKELIEQGLEIAGDDPDLLVRAAAVAVEVDDREFAKSLLPRLPQEGPGLLLRVQISAREGDWKYLASLHGDDALNSVPSTETATVKALASSGHAKILAKRDRPGAENFLVSQMEANTGAARPLVLLAQMAEDLGFESVAKSAYDQAVAAVRPDSHIANRHMVASYAGRRRDHTTVAKLLDGFVDLTTPSEELDELSTAFAYQYPPKARGLGFFKELPEEMRDTERMAFLEGILHIHRQDLPAAQERFEAAVRLAPTKLRAMLMLVQVLLRQKMKPAALELASRIDPTIMAGSPLDRMHLAHLLAMSGRHEEAFELGYTTLGENRNDATVNLKWLGLGLTYLPHLARLSDGSVDVGMWVRLVSNEGQPNEFTIVDGPNRPADGQYAKDHTLAGAAIGHRAGEKFLVTDGLGRDREWTVERVRHRYHHAYEEVVEHFNDRFPNEDGFWVIKTRDDDIQPLLDVVRRQGERAQNLLGLYSDNTVPLSFIVEVAGGSVITFAETLRAQGVDIDTCENTEPERLHAMNAIRAHKGKGAVLDTLTHWTVVGLDAVDILQAVFGRLLVARSTLDDVQQLADNGEQFEGTERGGTAFFHKGQFYFDEMTEERELARARELEKREASLASEFEVMPVHAPDDLDTDLVDHVNRGALDPIFLAKEYGMLLISDDRRYRLLGRAMKVTGAWLHAVFYFAKHNRLVTHERYAVLTAELASLRHASIPLEASDVEELVAHTTLETKYRLHAMASCIGTRNAGMTSHLNVLRESLERVWQDGPTLDRRLLTGLMIRNAIRFHPEARATILRVVEGTLSQYLGGAEYFQCWKVGHFIPDGVFSLRLPSISTKNRKQRRQRGRTSKSRDWYKSR